MKWILLKKQIQKVSTYFILWYKFIRLIEGQSQELVQQTTSARKGRSFRLAELDMHYILHRWLPIDILCLHAGQLKLSSISRNDNSFLRAKLSRLWMTFARDWCLGVHILYIILSGISTFSIDFFAFFFSGARSCNFLYWRWQKSSSCLTIAWTFFYKCILFSALGTQITIVCRWWTVMLGHPIVATHGVFLACMFFICL